ncbi:MAG: glycosyltransferase [Rhodobacteraceae bacterium]|nr:glycosyltransferase [Paracoccaceae bacterium]
MEQTLKSVAAQTVRPQYIVIDGKSSDGSLAIYQQYRNCIDVLVSEPDDGQYHAIEKGMKRATGEILCWLNADDILMPWTVSVVSEIFEKFPDIMWITGLLSFLNGKGQLVQVQKNLASYPQKSIAAGRYSGKFAGYLQQESMFWRRSLWDQVDGLDLNYQLAADFDLWTRFAKITPLVPVDIPLAAFRERPGEQRSSEFADQYTQEVEKCCRNLPPANFVWRFFAGKGVVFQNLCRMFRVKRSRAIIYSRKNRAWQEIRSFRSGSRMTFQQLVHEYSMRRRS